MLAIIECAKHVDFRGGSSARLWMCQVGCDANTDHPDSAEDGEAPDSALWSGGMCTCCAAATGRDVRAQHVANTDAWRSITIKQEKIIQVTKHVEIPGFAPDKAVDIPGVMQRPIQPSRQCGSRLRFLNFQHRDCVVDVTVVLQQ